ncbi:MAG: hypothetical protein LDL26_00345 [Caenispirillum bisanense]|nr:hypothetical protein [Caenispirillum bisanense]
MKLLLVGLLVALLTGGDDAEAKKPAAGQPDRRAAEVHIKRPPGPLRIWCRAATYRERNGQACSWVDRWERQRQAQGKRR